MESGKYIKRQKFFSEFELKFPFVQLKTIDKRDYNLMPFWGIRVKPGQYYDIKMPTGMTDGSPEYRDETLIGFKIRNRGDEIVIFTDFTCQVYNTREPYLNRDKTQFYRANMIKLFGEEYERDLHQYEIMEQKSLISRLIAKKEQAIRDMDWNIDLAKQKLRELESVSQDC